MQIEKEILHVLKNATRIGWREDSPEGNRYIQISDTYANELAKRLEAHLTQRAVDRLWRVWAWFFDRTLMACGQCGALVGMNSTFFRGRMWCEPCYQRYVAPERNAAQHGVEADALPCGHNAGIEFGESSWSCVVCGQPVRRSR